MRIRTIAVAVIALLLAAHLATAQVDPEIERRLAEVEEELASQNRQVESLKDGGGGCFILFLFGFVLSVWAMSRNRDGCIWFILGCIPLINIFAALIALNADFERRTRRLRDEPPGI